MQDVVWTWAVWERLSSLISTLADSSLINTHQQAQAPRPAASSCWENVQGVTVWTLGSVGRLSSNLTKCR
jgi:hypothetical protein